MNPQGRLGAMSRFAPLAVVGSFLIAAVASADTQPRYKAIPSLGWSLDRVVDLTSAGTVTGTTVAATDLDCTGYTNGGALTTLSSGEFVCSDDAGGGAGGDITDVNEGLAIDVTDSTGPAPSVAFDPTELTGSRTWGDASTDTIVWTLNRATGTDPTLTFGSNTVTGQIVAASSAFELSGDQITDLTGTGLSVSGGALTVGNAATATALAANGTNCSASQAPLGVDASGAVESCTDFEEELTDSVGLHAALSDETGTGVAVFDTAPTFTTSLFTPAILSTAADSADAGFLRLGNAEILAWEASPAAADVTLTVDTSEILQASGAFTSGGTITGVAGTFSGLVTANANVTIGNGATGAGVLTLNEDTDAGSNFASFQVPALAANTVYTLPADDGAANEVLSTDGTGVLDWVAAGAGDVTSVGDVASGAAFDGTQGTTLTFNDASGDQTLLYNSGGDLDFNFSDDVNIRDATPHLQLIDTTASQDDFEIYADASQFYLTNVTDSTEYVRIDASHTLHWGQTHDFGDATSLEAPNGANPTVDAAGEIAQDTTDDQLLYGATPRVLPYERSVCMSVENVAAADDNVEWYMANDAITITAVGCHCAGTCTTAATFAFEDRAGNAMTGSPTCSTTTSNTTFTAITVGGGLAAGESIRFDVTNAVSPETDEYLICFTYTVDRQ